MAKNPRDYFSDLAKVTPSPTGMKPIANTRRKKGGPPIGLILLVASGLSLYSFVHYFDNHDPTDMVKTIVNNLPDSAKSKIATELAAHHLNPSQIMGTSAQPPSAMPAAIPAQRAIAAAQPNQIQYVEIEGKWYKKTSNNVYMVNGHAVFYVDGHRAAAPNHAVAPAQNSR